MIIDFSVHIRTFLTAGKLKNCYITASITLINVFTGSI